MARVRTDVAIARAVNEYDRPKNVSVADVSAAARPRVIRENTATVAVFELEWVRGENGRRT